MVRNKIALFFICLIVFLVGCAPIPQTPTLVLPATAIVATETSTAATIDNVTATVTAVNGEPGIDMTSPDMTKLNVENGMAYTKADLCLFKDATPQCFVPNPENEKLFGQNLKAASMTIGYIGTWDAKAGKPGKYKSYEAYAAMINAHPVQKASDVPMLFHTKAMENSKTIGWTMAMLLPASEYVLPDGSRLGSDAQIDFSQTGFRFVDWSKAETEDGWTGILAGPRIKEVLEPVDGSAGVYRVVWEMTDYLSSAELSRASQYGVLSFDPMASSDNNQNALTQKLNWMFDVMKRVGAKPKDVLDSYGGAKVEFAQGTVTPSLMEKMNSGTRFLIMSK